MLQTCRTGRAQAHLRNVAGLPHRSIPGSFAKCCGRATPVDPGSFAKCCGRATPGRAQDRFAKCCELAASIERRFVLRNVAGLPHRSRPNSFCEMLRTCRIGRAQIPFARRCGCTVTREASGSELACPAAQGWNCSHEFACHPWTFCSRFVPCAARPRNPQRPGKARRGIEPDEGYEMSPTRARGDRRAGG